KFNWLNKKMQNRNIAISSNFRRVFILSIFNIFKPNCNITILIRSKTMTYDNKLILIFDLQINKSLFLYLNYFLNFFDFFTRKFNRCCFNIFFQTRKLSCSGNWYKPVILIDYPSYCQLSRSNFFSYCKL